MLNYYLVCRSVTFAQRTARALDSQGITAYVTRTPRHLPVNSCSYCVKIPDRLLAQSLMCIKNAALPPVRVFAQDANGTFGEHTNAEN